MSISEYVPSPFFPGPTRSQTIKAKIKRRRDELICKQAYRCAYCGILFGNEVSAWDWPSRDHIVAVAAGGKNKPNNTVFACRECNSIKGACSVEDAHDRLTVVAQIRRWKAGIYPASDVAEVEL